VVFAALCGLAVIISGFFTTQALTVVKNELDQWFLIVTAFMVLVGLVNLNLIHFRKISQKREGWGYSVVLLAGAYFFIVFGLLRGSLGDAQYSWFYNGLIVPMSSTTFSLLMFYIASASYRAFRVRTAEATVLLTSAVIMMIGVVPIGRVIWSAFPDITSWILNYPNTAGIRGIQLGACIGGMATALRILVGIERGHLGGEG
jgi:hypothetical protein